MFQLITPIAALLKSVTPRQEHHGEEIVVALSLRLELTAPNTILDVLSPKLRHALYTAVEGQEHLPGVEQSTPLLRFNAFDHHAIKACFEGWILRVAHGIEEDAPIEIGGCKVDAFRVKAMQGGTIKLAFRVGTNDVDPEEIGLLCGKLGGEINITLTAPAKPADAINASSSAKDLPPSAEDLFSGGDNDDEADDGDEDGDAPQELEGRLDKALVIETSRPGTRTARGRAQTKAALAAGLAEAEGAS